jgi:hypothetical protein
LNRSPDLISQRDEEEARQLAQNIGYGVIGVAKHVFGLLFPCILYVAACGSSMGAVFVAFMVFS